MSTHDEQALRAEVQSLRAQVEQGNERTTFLTAAARDAQELAASYIRKANALQKERDHWKANHADMVARARVLRERTDCPLERVQAFEEIGRAHAERDALRSSLSEMTADRDSWERQASDRTDDAVRFAAERDALRAQLEAARKDQARYQWLRPWLDVDDVGDENAVYALTVAGESIEEAAFVAKCWRIDEVLEDRPSPDDAIDAAIQADAARKAEGEQHG